MLILWTLLITAASAHKVYDSNEDIGPEAFQNVTTLYPIIHNPINFHKTSSTSANNQNDQKHDKENNVKSNETNSKENTSTADVTVWKIDAAFSNSNLDDNDTSTVVKQNITELVVKKNETKEFKPSPHLGNFFDEDEFELTPTKASFDSFVPVKKPTSGFVSSSKDDFRSSFTKTPKQIYKQFPYKSASPILIKSKDTWKERPDSLESKPTVEIPINIPAGGFYKHEDPFKNNPGSIPDLYKDKPGNENDEFGLGFTEGGKFDDSAIKKRVGPWEHFLQLVTAFLPVGLIISALTPSLITIEQTGPGVRHTYPTNIFRRSAPETLEVSAISERCRRRLLCELHSENNYASKENSPVRRSRPCYKIHCEDTEALTRTLQWLLKYRKLTQTGHSIRIT